MEAKPKELLMCYLCRLVLDEATGSWIPQKTYQAWTGVDPASFRIMWMYCPSCFDLCISVEAA